MYTIHFYERAAAVSYNSKELAFFFTHYLYVLYSRLKKMQCKVEILLKSNKSKK